ncbi:phage baseplate assembly protein J [Salmonella enterica subsp. enterica serovar Typhi]|nr:phage baseplate assembly protein J [Salmonella enterica subsp. enterica serovar Typhi]
MHSNILISYIFTDVKCLNIKVQPIRTPNTGLAREAEPVMAAAKASLQKYIASQTRLGRDIRRSAIFAALHVEGVQRVELASPLADMVLNKTQAASCTQWSVTNGGTDE